MNFSPHFSGRNEVNMKLNEFSCSENIFLVEIRNIYFSRTGINAVRDVIQEYKKGWRTILLSIITLTFFFQQSVLDLFVPLRI